MLLLRRLKVLGAIVPDLLDVYMKEVRSVVEVAVPEQKCSSSWAWACMVIAVT